MPCPGSGGAGSGNPLRPYVAVVRLAQPKQMVLQLISLGASSF